MPLGRARLPIGPLVRRTSSAHTSPCSNDHPALTNTVPTCNMPSEPHLHLMSYQPPHHAPYRLRRTALPATAPRSAPRMAASRSRHPLPPNRRHGGSLAKNWHALATLPAAARPAARPSAPEHGFLRHDVGQSHGWGDRNVNVLAKVLQGQPSQASPHIQ